MKLTEPVCMYIAGLIDKAGPELGPDHRRHVAELFATDLAGSNPLFEREKFLRTCGVPEDQIVRQDVPLF